MAFKLLRPGNGSAFKILKDVTISSLALSAQSLARRNAGAVAAASDGTQVLYYSPNATVSADTKCDLVQLQAGDVLRGDYTGSVSVTVGDFVDLENSTTIDASDTTEGSDGKLRVLSINTTDAEMDVEFVV